MGETGDKLEFVIEKYEDFFMILGGVSTKGLIPSEAPIFVCDLKEEWTRLGNPKTRGVTGDMYAHMVKIMLCLLSTSCMDSVKFGRMTQQPSIGLPMHWKLVLLSSSGFLMMNRQARWRMFGPLRMCGP